MEALQTLTSTIAAYKSREKFEVDFPELAKYLPARTVVSNNTALAVPIEDIKAKFAKMGIPPGQ